MTRFIITPWRYSADLLTVRQQLYRLDGTDNRRLAVDRVMAWRMRGNLPHAVESTALLVDAFNHHDTLGNSSFSVRAVYAAAFCRFVTGYCDIGRNRERSLESSSMLEIARQIAMPLEFVALRHEATHEELPSEKRIMDACEHALQWLWRVYWSRLDEAGATDSTPEANRVRTRKLFKDHRTSTKHALKTSLPPAQRLANASRLVEEFLEVPLSGDACAEVAGDIVDKGLLIPSDRLVGTSMDGAFLLWDDLLLAFARQSELLSHIVDSMLCTLTANMEIQDDAVIEANSAWLLNLACSSRWIHLALSAHIMKYCILHANDNTAELGQKILSRSDEYFQEEYACILDAARMIDQVKTNDVPSPKDADDACSDQPWHQAILEPAVPIGVSG